MEVVCFQTPPVAVGVYRCMQVAGKVQSVVGDDKLDAVVCVAGGWAGGNAASQGAIFYHLHGML